ncbi:respiratory nitrate reductase subunit gamma [Streptomyces collinus]|uniref:respiratory nitrate reductase subunit gamma n=1 Tax=Streptomyces collinus TaxID=42684 RepID=UPI00362C1D19
MPAAKAVQVAREMARNAEESKGRTMIIMGAGICQWFHGDATYRAILALLMLTGAMGRNGGGWAHYVGQEKCRPVTGWSTLAMASDWQRPPRQAIGTAYWYTHTDQWRYDGYWADALTSPLARGDLAGLHTADTLALSARLGWMPSYPQFDRNPLDLVDEADALGEDPVAHVTSQLWPFTRLVHAFTAPLGYLFRPYVVYRSRDARAPRRPTRRGWERPGPRQENSRP